MSAGTSATRDVCDILLREIPGALNVHPAHDANDRDGVDWWVEVVGCRHLAVDAKVRERDWAATHPGEDDLALETWNVIERKEPGWTRDPSKRADFILWLWRDTGRWCLIPFAMLCRVFRANWREWSERYKTARQFTGDCAGGYHSECVFVPRKVVWAEMYRRFGGALADNPPEAA